MAEDMMGADATSGPEGEPFAEEERKRKYIIGTIALIVGILATIILFYAFGITSAGVEEETGDSTKGAATKQK